MTKLTTFIALYRGESVSGAKLLALSADPALVEDFAGRLLEEPEPSSADAVLSELERGRRRALRLVRSGTQ